MKAKIWLADILFYVGHNMIIGSALLMGYEDTAQELRKTQARWLKSHAFKTKRY